MKKNLLRYVAPVALAVGVAGGALGATATAAGASTTSAKTHHQVKHDVRTVEHHQHKKNDKK